MDIDELKAELAVANDTAFELADELAEKIAAGHDNSRSTQELALAYQGKRRDIRRLRRALKAEVAG